MYQIDFHLKFKERYRSFSFSDPVQKTEDFTTPINELAKKVQALGVMHSVSNDNHTSNFTTPPSAIFKTDLKSDYNPITPLRFSESDEEDGGYKDKGSLMKTPLRSDMLNDLGDVDFTPIKTPWRKSTTAAYEGVIEDGIDDYVEMNYSPSEEEGGRSSSVDTNDLLTFTPMGGGADGRGAGGNNDMSTRKSTAKNQQQSAIQLDYTNTNTINDNSRKTTNTSSTKDVKSKLDLFLENNKELLRSMGKAEQVFKRATEKVLAQCSSSSLMEEEEEDHTTPVNYRRDRQQDVEESESLHRKQPADMTTPTATINTSLKKDQKKNPTLQFDEDSIAVRERHTKDNQTPKQRHPSNLINFITPFKSPPAAGNARHRNKDADNVDTDSNTKMVYNEHARESPKVYGKTDGRFILSISICKGFFNFFLHRQGLS